MTSGNKRATYVDIVRIAAAYFVVLLHTAGIKLLTLEAGSVNFIWAVFYDALSRGSVPLFIMLSGMLFLRDEKKLDIKRLWRKNILRLVTAFVFWSYIYNFYQAYVESRSVPQSLLKALVNTPHGAMHLWFVFVMVGLYIVTPLVKRMAERLTKRETEYFLVLNIILTFLPKTLSSFEALEPYVKYLDNFEIAYAAGYVGLFLAGHYIDKYEHGKAFRVCSYLAALMGFLYMFLMTAAVSDARRALADEFMSFKSLSAYLMAFGAMMAAKTAFAKRPFKRRTVSVLGMYAGYMFGVYLVHELIIAAASAAGITILPDMPYLGIPLEAAAVFILSVIVSAVIGFFPFGKYIV